ncbi:MAG: NUDIX domain-containing protein [Propionibacteriaceae bacterium]|jgi:ADP-ribose pyrophosphatase YjhB (NUDIX family)|nr:NUDIX domain-containing protein [Propionibacteriaceae bacterium]
MPHLHTEPGQRDITVSALIVRLVDDEWRCLVHLHRRFGTLMQVGGHIDLDETPWAALAHELTEESGYTLDDLQVLQPFPHVGPAPSGNDLPLPAYINSHRVDDTPHYHVDLAYALVAEAEPTRPPGPGESTDLRWYTPDELDADSLVIATTAYHYRDVIERIIPQWHRVDASGYPLTLEPE